MDTPKVWLVTGASKGFGYESVKLLLEKGYRVAATSRDSSKLEKRINSDHFLPLTMEVANEESVSKAVSAVMQRFGKIDVLVNNAGYGLLGGIEELADEEIRKVFAVNVFGLINVSRSVLPIMRKQQSGRILNIASVSGSVSAPATGIYSATKAAVIQISEALSKEAEEFGIKVTAICPGGFRTDFLDKSSMATPKNEIPEYTLVRNTVERFGELNKNQGGDPKKAAAVFIKIGEMPNPPCRIYLGSDALRMMKKKIADVSQSLDTYFETSQESDY
ncbi:SDR family oxidoreductase [Sinomicrobium weinanense]|uniref:SDR family oxidoreductase n=1 Tax=Sinomicrobium weinanense TaxID=2842200 RepID=A0A926JVA6_9FLAO|nr:SDR family oxidoreductase [Sinomicrobium weinanense]MBC9798019.1 SDR family oxidoreductase [Sinomicrobium weinanense]MBU3125870.1 SDR family oxidoreductase [Sinomicrobium weinanense]